MKHTNGPDCPRCNEMLKGVHPDLLPWALWTRERFPNAHFFTIWRGKLEQEKAVAEGKSQKEFPFSKHNFVNANGEPASEAWDLFRLSEKGKAEFPNLWYLQVADALEQAGAPIEWGGDWPNFKDLVHYELKELAPPKRLA